MAVGQEQARWDTNYEWKIVLLLGIGFGLVGLDRWIIVYLWDTGIAPDLGLNAGHLGNLVGALGLLWGFFAIFSGRLSDGIGHRKILIPAIFIFSLMSLRQVRCLRFPSIIPRFASTVLLGYCLIFILLIVIFFDSFINFSKTTAL